MALTSDEFNELKRAISEGILDGFDRSEGDGKSTARGRYRVGEDDPERVQKLNNITRSLESIARGLKDIDAAVMKIADSWSKVDEAAAKYARTMGQTLDGLKALRNEAIRGVVKGKIGYDFGMDPQELLEAQERYVKAVGRNVRISMEDQKNLAAATRIFGNSEDFFNDFEKFGLSLSSSAEHMGKMYSEAGKSGISLEKYAKNVQQGLAMAQTYTFRGGIRGMEEMAKRATAIRMEMSQVQSFAESFSTIEKAIENTARLQVLGGPFATGADALGLLNDSLNGLEDVEKRMEQFTKDMGTFNKATGEVSISQFNKMRLREYADITGQDYNKVMEVAQRQAMRGEIEAQMSATPNLIGLDEDFKELIKNSATFKDGKAGVSIDGKFKTLEEITEKDRDALVAYSRSDSENIQDIAKNVRSLTEYRKGIGAQYRGVKANTVGRVAGNVALAGAQTLTGWGDHKGLGNFPLFLTALGSTALSLLTMGVSGYGVGKGFKGLFKGGGSTSVSAASKIVSKKAAQGAFTKAGTPIYNAAGQRIYGAAARSRVESVGLKAASKKVAAKTTEKVVAKKAAQKATSKIVEKAAEKGAAKMGGKLALGVAKAGPWGIIGAAGDIAADILVEKGKMKKGGGAHSAMKIGASTAEWAALGSMIAPGVGTAVGAAIGAGIGALKVDKIHKELVVDNQLQALGIERKGKYSSDRLAEIDRALQTGRMSNALRKKLIRKGDMDIVNQINSVKDDKKKERQERRDKRREQRAQEIKTHVGTAKFEVEKAYFGGEGIWGKTDNGVTIRKGKKEDGSSKELSQFKRTANRVGPIREERLNKSEIGPIDININGSLKLEGSNGQSVDIIDELRRNHQLLNQLAELIIGQTNARWNGGVPIEDRSNGDNMKYGYA